MGFPVESFRSGLRFASAVLLPLDNSGRLRHVPAPARSGKTMSDTEDSLPPRLPVRPPPPASPLAARMLNLFATPGVVFEEVRVSAHAVGNWVVPALIAGLAMALAALVLSASPTFAKRTSEQQEKFRAAQTNAVAAGRLTTAEMEQSVQTIAAVAQPAVVRPLALLGGFTFGVLRVFWWSGLLWVFARGLLRQPVGYQKLLEVAGLSSLIAALSAVVLLAVMINFRESFQGGGFTLVVNDLSDDSMQWPVVLALNIMNFWQVAILGLGLARLAQVPWFRAAFPVLVYWIGTEFLMVLAGGIGF
jgi:hypothetical protein